jgi:teichuronic acid exporter
MDSLILGKIAGEHVLGFYAMAKQLATMPVNKISVVVNQLAMPLMAGMQNDVPAMRQCFLRGLRLVSCFAIPMCIGMALVADDLIQLILSDKWLPLVPLFQVCCGYALIHSLAVLFPPILFARFRLKFLFAWTITLIVVMTIGFWVGATWSQGIGTALVLVALYPIFVVWMADVALNEIRVSWKDIWDQTRSPVIASLLMATAILLVVWIMPDSHANAVERLLRISTAVVAGIIVYGLGIIWRDGRLVGEVKEIAGWLVRRGNSFSPAK